MREESLSDGRQRSTAETITEAFGKNQQQSSESEARRIRMLTTELDGCCTAARLAERQQ